MVRNSEAEHDNFPYANCNKTTKKMTNLKTKVMHLNDTSDFDTLLLQAIDETIRYCLGDINAQLIYNYLERKGILKKEIPQRLDDFVMEFENVVGFGRGQVLGAAQIIEEAILKAFCTKLKINYVETGSRYFPYQIKMIKETYRKSPLKKG